jgi:hypothetical protein
MGLFDIFKKKPDQKINNNLTLEMLVQKAATEPGYRAEFYRRLLLDELFVITQNSGLPIGDQTLKQDTKVNIVSFSDGKIPLFTSPERIFDKGVIKEQVEYLMMKGENILRLSKGVTFLLNPYSDYGKELLPEEVERILNGQILTDTSKTIKIQKETKVQIGQPAKYPTEIVNSLNILFSNKPNVKAAYLGWIYNPDSEEPPHYIFGIDADGDLQSLTQDAGFTAKQFLSKNEFVDFVKIGNNNMLTNYFLKNTKPFYKR